jgi:hypothetical protein
MSVMAQGYTMLAMRKLLLTYALIIGIALTVACEGATPENIPSAVLVAVTTIFTPVFLGSVKLKRPGEPRRIAVG